jgi:ribosomal protein S18 acetylase RimI-like enzyme
MTAKTDDTITIRKGKIEDLQAVYDLVLELAEFEKAPNEVENTIDMMKEDGFGANPIFGFLVSEAGDTIVGLSLYYYRYSTWKGKMLYLEDLIVTEQFRNQGIGKKLFDATIVEAGRSGCQGMIWQVLDWNEPAIEFYRKYDPVLDNQWVTCRLTREQILNHNPVS